MSELEATVDVLPTPVQVSQYTAAPAAVESPVVQNTVAETATITSAQANQIIGELAKINATLSANVNHNTQICAPEIKTETAAAAPVVVDTGMVSQTAPVVEAKDGIATQVITAAPSSEVSNPVLQAAAPALAAERIPA